MESLSRREREKALSTLVVWSASELQGIEPDEHTLQKLGFGSAEAMRIQLKNWGLPKSLLEKAAGAGFSSAPAGRAPKKSTGKSKDRRARGPVQELPPSKGALPLLQQALDRLRSDLKLLFYLQSGDRRTPEYLQDGRFIQDTRQDAPRWAPDVGGSTRVAGATQAPGNGLAELIAVYLIAGGDPEPLIEKLHYEPDKLDREKLGRVLHGDENNKPGLLRRAVQAARLIRGADSEKGGRWPAVFDVDEMATRHRILDMRAAGRSDQEIFDTLSSEGISISKADLRWLAGLDLPALPR